LAWRSKCIGITGPGLLESFHAAASCWELERANVRVRREVDIPVTDKGQTLALGVRADILADETVILEIKAVPALLPARNMHPRCCRRATCNCSPTDT
jgi:GxxExxY protein